MAAVSKSKDLKKATEELKKVATGTEVLEVPEGDPLFLFSSAVGKPSQLESFTMTAAATVFLKKASQERNWMLS